MSDVSRLQPEMLFFASVMVFSFVHECAHYGAARFLGMGARVENRGLFGNVMYMDGSFAPMKKMCVYLAGPGINMLLALTGLAVKEFISSMNADLQQLAEIAVYANIMLAALNLLPFFPLDGGRAVLLIMSELAGYNVSVALVRFFSRLFALSVFLLGIYLVKYNLMNIILIFDAIYFVYIVEREFYEPY